MNIFVDGEKIAFELEKEKDLFEVASGVQDWLGRSHRFVRSFRVGERTFPQVDESMKAMAVESLSDLHIETMTAEALAAEALADVTVFFGRLKGRPSDRLPPAHDVVEALHWSYNVVSKARVVLHLDYNEIIEDTTVNKELVRLGKLVDSLRDKIDTSTADSDGTLRLINQEIDFDLWIRLLSALSEKISAARPPAVPDKAEALKKLEIGLMEIPELRLRIEKISTLLHSGGDSTAMDQLSGLSTSLAGIIQGLQSADPFVGDGLTGIRLKEGTTIADELTKLTGIFKRIVEAFDSKDIVLLCDLLEYELLPSLSTLEDILNLLKQRIDSSYS